MVSVCHDSSGQGGHENMKGGVSVMLKGGGGVGVGVCSRDLAVNTVMV